MHFADQGNLFSIDLRAECVRGETGTCLGPCAGLCTRTQYTAQLRAARAFLDGRDSAALIRLEEEVATAAVSQQFERAATIRDRFVRLQHLSERLAMLRERPLPEQFIYPAEAGRRSLWYLVAATRVVAAMAAPEDAAQAARCLVRLRRIYEPRALEELKGDRLSTQILSGWFRSRPAELATALTPGDAVQFCQRLGA
jgi:excinuclease ABC subunit C